MIPKNNTNLICQRISFETEDTWEDKLAEHRIGGRRAVSVAELLGKGSPDRSVFFSFPRPCLSARRGGVTCRGAHW